MIVPTMVLSLFVVQQGGLSFTLVATMVILRDVALVALVLFFLWRNGESFAKIGWHASNPWREIVLGVGLFVPFLFATDLTERLLREIGFPAPATKLPSFLTPDDWPQEVLGVALVAVVAIAEETIFRGYLLLRLRAIARSTPAAVLLSSLIFSLGARI